MICILIILDDFLLQLNSDRISFWGRFVEVQDITDADVVIF